jgi:energy-converting hydrogenase Eha subunit B
MTGKGVAGEGGGITGSYFKTCVFCHPERSEGSQVIKNTRFFASLRMTYEGVFEVLQ